MRLIDADGYEQRLLEMHKKMVEKEGKFYEGICFGLEYASGYISIAPTIDAQPVRHGKWIYTALCDCNLSTVKCSRCDYECTTTADIAVEISDFNYCPNCGARMDKNN